MIIEQHLSEIPGDIENSSTEHVSAGQIFDEKNMVESETQEKKHDVTESELILMASIPDEKGLEVDRQISIPNDKGTEFTSEAPMSNGTGRELSAQTLNTDGIITKPDLVASIFREEATNFITEPPILIEKETNLTLGAPILQYKSSIIDAEKTNNQVFNFEFQDTKNTIEALSNHEIVDKHSNETILEIRNPGKMISVDQKSYESKNHVEAEQTGGSLEKVEGKGMIYNTGPDQSKPKLGKHDTSSCLDGNRNCSGVRDFNNTTDDMNVDQSDELKIENNIKKILLENDTTVYINKTMSSLYDLKCHQHLNTKKAFYVEANVLDTDKVLNLDSLHVEANVFDTDTVFNPVATYSLDLCGLELPPDCNNLLDISDEPAAAGSTPQALLNILHGKVYYSNDNPKKTPETNIFLPEPVARSIALDFSEPYSIVDRNNDKDSMSFQNTKKTPETSIFLPEPAGSSTVLEFSELPSTVEPDDDEDSKSSHEPDSEGYIPSSPDSSNSDANSAPDERPKKSISRKERQKKSSSSFNITLGENKPGMSAPDDAGLTVSTSDNAEGTKKYFCVYCQKVQSKLPRHLELVHSEKAAVQRFMNLPAKNRERWELIAAIRKEGSYLYNTDKRYNKGDLLVVRRPQARMKKGAKDFLACGNCHGQDSRAVIRHHFKRCTKKSSTKERLVIVKGRKVSGRVHEIANVLVRKYIFPYLREDAVVRAIRYDKLITLYAIKQCEKYGSHQHLYQMIRQRIRLLGRLFLEIKRVNSSIKTFSDIFQPRHYDDSVKAVRIVAGFDEIARTFAHPSVASNLGTMLKYVGEILRSEYIKEERTHDQKRVDDFLKLLSEDYGTSVNRAVLETQLQNNRRKIEVLPNLDDITKLHNFLKIEREIYFERLNEELTLESWQKLAKVTLFSLQLFNRRRAGEIERVYLEDFDSYHGIDEIADKETYASLSRQGQALARKYVRFMIRGKLGRGVPVLVPSNLLDALLLIRQYRHDVGVPNANPYLFGVPSKDKDRFKYLRACDLLRKFSQHCGAKVPSTLRGTKLRKHVATKCISLNLSENQVSDLANFMGHADKIHKEIYRQPIIQNDIIKISQLLEMAQGTQDSSPNDEDSSSDEEENARPVVGAEYSSPADFEGNEHPADCDREYSTKSNGMSNINKSRTSNSASRLGTSHRRWTELERNTVLGAFNETRRTGKMPSGAQMQKLIDENECLKGREVAQLRTWLHTQKKKICRN